MARRRDPGLRRDSVLQWCSELYDRLWVVAGELGLFAASVVGMVAAGWILGRTWVRAWESTPPGLVRTAATRGAGVVPLLDGGGVVMTVVFAMLLGMVSVLLFDPYKRIEGLAAVAGVVAAGVAVSTGVHGVVTLRAQTVALGVIGALVGVRATGVGGANATSSVASLRGRLDRFAIVSVAVAVVGVVEANTGPDGPAATGVPNGAALPTAGVGLLVSVAAVGVLGVALWKLRIYETSRDVLVLGPQRAGKTYLIGGLAHSLKKRSADRRVGAPAVLNDQLEGENGLYRKFRTEEFDDIGTTEPGEAHVYEIRFLNGWIFRRQMTIRLLDYGGELYGDLEPNTLSTEPIDTREPLTDPAVVDELTERVNGSDRLPPETIQKIMTVMLHHASVVGLVVPMDDCDGHLSYPEDYPDHLDAEADLDKDRDENYMLTHGRVLEAYRDEKTIFLLATMADFLFEEFGRSARIDPLGFRRHVFETIVEHHDGIEEVGGHFETSMDETSSQGVIERIRSENPVVPVYLEPKGDHDVDAHEPDLDPGYSDYPLFGLRYLLRRFRR